jgi:heme oxygenase
MLRERTSLLHTEAERSGIVSDILRKKADRRSYAMLLRNLLPAYVEMERALEYRDASSILTVFARPELRRADRIATDLEALCGRAWQRDLPLLPAGERYAARVAMAGEGDGIRLVAHAYVRYFGDLSGGQVLKKMLGGTLGLGPEALTFYDFPDVPDPASAKNEMRFAIDREGAVLANGESIVEEGILAFEHNIDVSRSVQALAAAKVVH